MTAQAFLVNGVIWVCAAIFGLLVFSLSYHYLLLVAACFPRKPARRPLRYPKFAVLIPAYNEAAVIGSTIDCLHKQEYPLDRYDIYAVADYCSDRTADEARAHGAICLERSDGPRGRKAYALQWAIGQVLAGSMRYDALVIIDADSRVDARFLQTMAGELDGGAQVLQGQHIIADASDSRYASLADVDMRLNNLLRNQAKCALGLAARLMGDAMCFAEPVLRAHGWVADSFGEDREYGAFLTLHGLRVIYVPEARSRGQAAQGWRDASQQRARWVAGSEQLGRRLGWRLLWAGLRRTDPAVFDQGLDFVLPPYSLSVMLVAALTLTVFLTPRWAWPAAPAVPAVATLLWLLLPLLGLTIARAPSAAFSALLWGPFYLVWRVAVELRVSVARRSVRWVRTRRKEEH